MLFCLPVPGSAMDNCSALLAGSAGGTEEVSSHPFTYNLAAQKFIQLANQTEFLGQNDRAMRVAGLSEGGFSRICVSVTFRHIHMALNALRAHPAVLDDPITSLNKIFEEAHKVAVEHNLDNTDPRKGLFVWVLLAGGQSDIAKRRGLKSDMLYMERQPNDAVMEEALAPPKKAILQAAVVVKATRGFGDQHHSIAILGIDRATKQISYSDPMDPNQILIEPYWLGDDGKVNLRFRNAMNMAGYIQEAWKVEPAE
jgi:hypothetical protein